VSARLLAAIGRPGVEPGVALAADHLVAGLPIKNPPKKTPKKPPKKPTKNVFFGGGGFIVFFYENNTNFSLWTRFFMNK
jgi:hypothetical protein